MSKGITVTRAFHVRKGNGSQKQLRQGEGRDMPVGRVPRVAKLMALAIRFDQLIRDGAVADQAELARLGHVTRAQLTQIMNLLNFAPDIQEQILFLPRTVEGRDTVADLGSQGPRYRVPRDFAFSKLGPVRSA